MCIWLIGVTQKSGKGYKYVYKLLQVFNWIWFIFVCYSNILFQKGINFISQYTIHMLIFLLYSVKENQSR